MANLLYCTESKTSELLELLSIVYQFLSFRDHLIHKN